MLADLFSNRGLCSVEATIRYRCHVDQQQFESRRLTLIGMPSRSGYEQCEKGQAVEVSYDPSDPATAVLTAAPPHGPTWVPWLI